MTVNRREILLLVLATGFGIYTVAEVIGYLNDIYSIILTAKSIINGGINTLNPISHVFTFYNSQEINTYVLVNSDGFECPVAKEPISFTGDTTLSVNFMWDCSLLPNESVLGVTWLKENATIAKAVDNTFIPDESYTGRVERFGTFGISLHNISINDSGHYNIAVLLNGILKENKAADTACQSAYLPALPEELWGYHAWKHQLSVKGEDSSSLCDQQGPSKLEIGLICGFVPMTILGLGIVVWCVYHKRRNTNQRERKRMSPEQSQML